MDDKVRTIGLIVVFVALATGLALWYRSRPAPVPPAPPVVPVVTSIEPSKIPVMLEVGSSTGLADQMMAAVMLALREGFRGRLDVRFLDVNKDSTLKEKYGLKVVPAQIYYAPAGQEIGRHEGYASEEDILAKLKDLGYDLLAPPKGDEMLPEE